MESYESFNGFNISDFDLEVLEGDGQAVSRSSELAPLFVAEHVPFLAPRSANVAKRRCRQFFHDGQNPNAEPATKKRRQDENDRECTTSDGNQADHEYGQMLAPSVNATAVFQSEDNKSYLQKGLEDLLIAPLCGPDTLPFCSYLLQRYFSIASGDFRPHQQEVCLSVLQGVSTLAVCPTGWGKSLCYQFPMLVHRLLYMSRAKAWEEENLKRGPDNALSMPVNLQSKFCIVVSPLLSLMTDQMEKIRSCGCLKAITISSQVDAAREATLLRDLASPTSDIDVVFTSPEKYLGSVALHRLLQTSSNRLAMVCVDEVHCVSRWAFDFRPSFMYIARVLSDALSSSLSNPRPAVPFLCLTATATGAVVADIQQDFGIERTVVAVDQFRVNLHLDSVNLVEQQQRLHSLGGPATTTPTDIEAPSQRTIQDALVDAVREMPKPMIVYVHSRADADELSSYLASKVGTRSGGTCIHTEKARTNSTSAVFSSAAASSAREATAHRTDARSLVIRCYHAALSRHLRTATQQQFLHDKIDVLVATVAFGMGIDKPNIRSVVHAYAPSSLESYVQEIGRSGRDGLPSHCRVLYNPFDFYALRCRSLTSLISPKEVEAVVACIFRNPVTTIGETLMLVCPYKIAEELFVAEETVETLLFMMLTGAHHCFTGSRPVFKRIKGTCPIGYKVVEANQQAKDAGEGSINGAASGQRQQVHNRKSKSGTTGMSACSSEEVFASTGVGALLAKLNARDPVLDVFTGCRVVENQVTAVNKARMRWDDFQFRLQDLQNSGVLKLSRLSASAAYLIEVGDGFTDAACPAGQRSLSQLLLSCYNERLLSQAEALKTMFRVLAHPTHAAVQAALDRQGKGNEYHESWSPPPRALTKVEAVSIANDFVAKNGLRLRSTYEAVRCLLGIMPKSLIKHGKYAGQIPLALSWYVSSPYFGVLREFDVEWVLAVLKPHNLDEQRED